MNFSSYGIKISLPHQIYKKSYKHISNSPFLHLFLFIMCEITTHIRSTHHSNMLIQNVNSTNHAGGVLPPPPRRTSGCVTFPVLFINSSRLSCLAEPGLGVPLSSYLEGALYKLIYRYIESNGTVSHGRCLQK